MQYDMHPIRWALPPAHFWRIYATRTLQPLLAKERAYSNFNQLHLRCYFKPYELQATDDLFQRPNVLFDASCFQYLQESDVQQ
jgi:hypothetical protein